MKIGIITDIHEDVAGLEKALKLLEKYQCDEIACLGDIVGFHPAFYSHIEKRSALGCLNLIRQHCKWIVAGNHDLFAAKSTGSQKILDFNLGLVHFLSDFNQSYEGFSESWVSYEGELPSDLDEKAMQFILDLPHGIIPDLSGFRCMFSHYVFPDLTGSTLNFIKLGKELNLLRNFLTAHNLNISFTGHVHPTSLGIGFPKKITGARKYRPAIRQKPFSTLAIHPEQTLIILPGIAGNRQHCGFSILDTEQMELHTIPLYQNSNKQLYEFEKK